MDGGDGYWYGFANQGNSSGNATVLWVKIRQSDCSFTEGRWTISNAALIGVCDEMTDLDYEKWYYIEFEGRHGFVCGKYVERV